MLQTFCPYGMTGLALGLVLFSLRHLYLSNLSPYRPCRLKSGSRTWAAEADGWARSWTACVTIGRASNSYLSRTTCPPHRLGLPRVPVRAVRRGVMGGRQRFAETARRGRSAASREGLILRQSESAYTVEHSAAILKVKTTQEACAVAIEHLPGSGRECRMAGTVAS